VLRRHSRPLAESTSRMENQAWREGDSPSRLQLDSLHQIMSVGPSDALTR
jgi:hypothetical protein